MKENRKKNSPRPGQVRGWGHGEGPEQAFSAYFLSQGPPPFTELQILGKVLYPV